MSWKIRDWFDNIEKVLTTEAESAGLLEHSVTIGQIREFFMRDVLKKFIPSGLIIGSGQVISSKNGTISKQIDIIIFDNRFPRFSITGSSQNALYPIEGVIATIEIKTELKSDTLREALDNCYSVLKLPIEVQNPDKENEIRRLMNTDAKLTSNNASNKLLWRICPKTYIFAFKGYKEKYKDFNETIRLWAQEQGKVRTYYAPKLPNVIVGEGVIGITRDDWFHLTNDNIFLAIKTDIRFGILASHLYAVITDRIRPRHEGLDIAYMVKNYNPMKIYDEELRTTEKYGFGFENKD